ncbi:MAG TPA: M24 family metallopeptidase [Xanthobacteraceae bacterium]|jgi:Xaa-Pro aminopeptidase|nr:M24 family metallopeptidase [Xanthobacteraceae bacterium]
MPFLTRATFDYRRGLMNAMMRDNGFDALAVTAADFFQWATNFHVDVQTWERPIVVVVPLDGEPFALMNELSTNHVRGVAERGHLWVDDVTIYAEHPRLTARMPVRAQWAEALADLLRQHGLARGRIGVDAVGGPLARLPALLPDLRLVACLAQMRELRIVKCAEELAVHRDAGALSDWGQARYRENIRPGRRLQELDFTMAALISEEAARRFPGENAEVRTLTLSGPASASPHGNGMPTGATIEKGHGIVNICNVRLNGMMTENERTFFVGPPTNRQAALYEAARAANEAGAAAAVAGNPVSAIDAAAQAVIVAAGFGEHIIHRTGHGMGVQGHEYPDDMPFCHRPLMAGEVYSVEPGIYVYGLGGFRLDDTVVIGDKPELITQAPRDIKSNTIG